MLLIHLDVGFIIQTRIIALNLAKIAKFVDSMGCFRQARDDEDDKARKEANKRIEKQLAKDKLLYKGTHRLLLLGKLYSVVPLNVFNVLDCVPT